MATLEDTARALDQGITRLLNARDTLYQLDRMPDLPDDYRTRQLHAVQADVTQALADLAALGVHEATLTPPEVEEEHADA